MYLLYNWQLIREEDFSLSFTNRAFQYNDGLFDTLIIAQGNIRFLPDHLERMQQALRVLQLHVPAALLNPAIFTDYVTKLIKQNTLTAPLVRVKVHIWRAPGGLFTPEQNSAECLITAQAQNLIPAVIAQADFATTVRNNFSAVLRCTAG